MLILFLIFSAYFSLIEYSSREYFIGMHLITMQFGIVEMLLTRIWKNRPNLSKIFHKDKLYRPGREGLVLKLKRNRS